MGTPLIICSAPPHTPYPIAAITVFLFPSISFHISSISIPLASFLAFPLWPSLHLPLPFRGSQVLSQVRRMSGREFGYREDEDRITTGPLRKQCTAHNLYQLHSICDNIYKTLFLKENTAFVIIIHYSKPTKFFCLCSFYGSTSLCWQGPPVGLLSQFHTCFLGNSRRAELHSSQTETSFTTWTTENL